MSWTLFLYGVLPLLVFAVVEVYAGMRWAVGSAAVFAFADIFLTHASMGIWDPGSFVAFGTIVALGVVSVHYKNDVFFKLQPTIMAVLFAGILIYFQFFSVPLATRYLPLVREYLPPGMRATSEQPGFLLIMNRSCTALIGVFLVHGAICALAAFRFSTWAWLFARGVGIWILLFIAVVVVSIYSVAQGVVAT